MSTVDGVLYAADPPAGVTRHPDEQPEATVLIVIAAVFFPLATIMTFMRTYTRARISGKMSTDDYLMLAAWVCDVILIAFVLDMLNYGLGKHLWNVPLQPDLYPNFSLRNLLSAIFFCAATGLAKGSILLFYLRIFPHKALIIVVWTLFVFTVGYSFASVFVNIFSCTPAQASWRLEYVATASCINRPVFYFAQAGLGIFTDLATVLTPVPLLRTLQLPTTQKIAVAVMLTMGAFVCIVSGVRMQSLYVLLSDSDLTNNTVIALMWCILELNLSIIGGSIPAAKPFVRKIFPNLLGSSHRPSSSTPIYMNSRRSQPRRRTGDELGLTPGGKSQYSGKVSANARDEDAGSEEFIISYPTDSSVGTRDSPERITKTVEYGYDVETRKP